MASTSVTFDVIARTSGEQKLARMGAAANSAGGRFGGLTSKLARFAKVGALAAAAAAGMAVKLGVDAIGAASDLNETVSKTEQIFGRNAKALDKWSDGAARAFGQSKRQALDAASTFGIFGSSAGLTGRGLTDFSKRFTELSGDLASFNNTSPEQAIEAIGAAMRGESEPIRKYGVLLDDATLRNRALKMGLIDTVKNALTPQQKALAASQEILAQTGKAQGDFARTSEGLANQQRILKAQFENVKTEIGQKLLPVAVKFMNWMNDDLIPGAEKAWTWLQDKLGPAFGAVKGWIDRLRPSAEGIAGDTLPRMREVMDAVKDAFHDAEPFIRAVKTSFENMWTVAGPILKRFGQDYLPMVAKNIRFLGKAAGVMGNMFISVWNTVMQPFFSKLAGGVATIMESWADMLDVMAHVPGFGWARAAADKMHAAAAQAGSIADNLKKIPPYTRANVDIVVTRRGDFAGPNVPDNIGGSDFPSSRTRTPRGRAPLSPRSTMGAGAGAGGVSAAELRAALEGAVMVFMDGGQARRAQLTFANGWT